ncbi:hypothetical protein IWQ61_010068 [Dispira simplex]|nr:hypothetical protein IWQ61_010068 [Dispira simplex]
MMKFTLAIGLLACLSVVEGRATLCLKGDICKDMRIAANAFMNFKFGQDEKKPKFTFDPSSNENVALGQYICSDKPTTKPENFPFYKIISVISKITIGVDIVTDTANSLHCYYMPQQPNTKVQLLEYFDNETYAFLQATMSMEILWMTYWHQWGWDSAFELYKEHVNKDITDEDFTKFLIKGQASWTFGKNAFTTGLQESSRLTTGQQPTTHPSSE